jgi:hypothetical protein
MATIKVKGHEFESITIRDSHSRKALQFKNKIIQLLGKLGLTQDDIDVNLEPLAMKKVPAAASWYFDGHHMYYSYSAGRSYVENIAVVHKVIELLVDDLINGVITKEEFAAEFKEDHDIEEKRKAARELIGVPHDSTDMALINKKYKDLAKEHHPDREGGNTDKFKEINHAHKLLKRELE